MEDVENIVDTVDTNPEAQEQEVAQVDPGS